MANSGEVSKILSIDSDRAFSNLFEVNFPSDAPGSMFSDNIPKKINLKWMAEKITFDGAFTLDTEYSETLKKFYIKSGSKIKTASITFRESSTYTILDYIKSWMISIYDFTENYFKYSAIPPTRNIIITIEGAKEGSVDGVLELTEAIPTSITYPTYDWADGNPIKITAIFSFYNIEYISLPRAKNSASNTKGLLTPT
jgi:hypothetical protein